MKMTVTFLLVCSLSNLSGQTFTADLKVAAERSNTRTVISGNLPFEDSSAKFWVFDFSHFMEMSGINDSNTIKIDCHHGDFKLVLNISHPLFLIPGIAGSGSLSPGSVFKGIISARYCSYGIMLEPGDSIDIKIDPNERAADFVSSPAEGLKMTPFFNLLAFTGKGSSKLQCIKDIIKGSRSFSFLPEADFHHKVAFSDSVTGMIVSIVNGYNDKISKIARTMILADYIPMLAMDMSEITPNGEIGYFEYLKMLKKSEASFDRLVDANDSGLNYTFFYPSIIIRRELVRDCILNARNIDESIALYNLINYRVVSHGIMNSPVKMKILGKYIQESVIRYGISEEVIDMIDQYREGETTDNLLLKEIVAYIISEKGRFAKGVPAYIFKLIDTSGKVVSLSDFRGKVVLLDFMFTGCPGCYQIVPALKAVEDKYKNDTSIEFISISISPNNSSLGGWKAGIGKFSVSSSLQLCAGGVNVTDGYQNPVNRNYGISAFPQLVLIDKNGNLISNKVPRPDVDNGKALIALINSSL
jgi:thiol-disulfide isomerase/thioredoxin